MHRLAGKLGPGGAPIRQAVAAPKRLGPETTPWFWHPNRVGVRMGPDSFRQRLWDELGSELEVTWHPLKERWLVWAKAPKIQHPLCTGWRLLFIHEGPDREYLPLDERVLARLYHASAMKHGDARKYFDRIAAEIMRDRETKEKDDFQDTMDKAMETGWDFSRIKVSGCGQSSGSKFSDFHA
jgi:hypothetical protein